MKITTLRPGVYAAYTTAPLYAAGRSAKAAAIAAPGGTHIGEVLALERYTQAEEQYTAPEDKVLLEALRRLFAGGVSKVFACALQTESPDYGQAFEAFAKQDGIGVVLCASEEQSVLEALRDSVQKAAAEQRERLAVAAVTQGEQALTLAAQCNCERMLLCCGSGDGQPLYLAAAMAALLLVQAGPDSSLNGAVLPTLSELTPQADNAMVEKLLAGGVVPFAQTGDLVECVRAVTTRTKTNGLPDATYRDVSTIRIIDHVMTAVRTMLRTRLRGLHNTPQAMESVASQITVVLSDLAAQGLLQQFEAPAVSVHPSDRSVCIVELGFTVAHVVSQIYVEAQITI